MRDDALRISIDELQLRNGLQMNDPIRSASSSTLPPPVLLLSDDPPLTDIFGYRLWEVEEAMDYLIGIFKFTKEIDTNNLTLTTLDGKIYCEPKDSDIIKQYSLLHDRLMEFWDHDDKNLEYTPAYFIRWGLRHKRVFEISWLNDALQKNLISSEQLKPKAQRISVQSEDLKESERNSVLSIIAGMAIEKYGYPQHTSIKRIKNDIERVGLSISDNSLSKYLKMALEKTPPSVRNKPHEPN